MKSRIPPPEKAPEHCCAAVGLVARAGGPTPARAPHLHTTHSRPLLEHAARPGEPAVFMAPGPAGRPGASSPQAGLCLPQNLFTMKTDRPASMYDRASFLCYGHVSVHGSRLKSLQVALELGDGPPPAAMYTVISPLCDTRQHRAAGGCRPMAGQCEPQLTTSKPGNTARPFAATVPSISCMASRSTNFMQLLADSGNIWHRLYNCLWVRCSSQGRTTPETETQKTSKPPELPFSCDVSC